MKDYTDEELANLSKEELMRLAYPSSKMSWSENAMQVGRDIKNDASSFFNALANLPKVAAKAPSAIAKNPGQAISGVFPALGSIVDLPNNVVKGLDYGSDKLYQLLFNPDNMQRTREQRPSIPDVGSKTGNFLADIVAGPAENSNQKLARGAGEFLFSMRDPLKTPGLKQAGQLIDKITPDLPKTKAFNNLTGNIEGDLEKGLQVKKAAESLGLNLTPAEATGNPLLAAQQGRMGSTTDGAKELYKFNKEQKLAQKNAIDNLLSDINASEENVYEAVRATSKNILDQKNKTLQEKAKPFYEAAANDVIGKTENIYKSTKKPKATLDDTITTIAAKLNPNRGPADSVLENIANKLGVNVVDNLNPAKNIKWPKNIVDDTNIINALQDVLNPKSPYANELKGFAPNSVKVLDRVKKVLDDKIESAIRTGDKELAKVYQKSKIKLVKELDKTSPNYKKARNIYSEDAPAIQKLANSAIGKIANMDDKSLYSVSSTIFDPVRTSPAQLAKYRDEIAKAAPEVWNGLIRNELERKLAKGEVTGSSFYKNILQDERFYKNLMVALKDNPNAQRKLAIMKDAFANLITNKTAKTAASQAKSSLDVARSSIEFVKKLFDDFIGGKYDKAAVTLITSGKWDDAFKGVQNSKDSFDKLRKLSGIMDSVKEMSQSKQMENEITDEQLNNMSEEELRSIINSQ